MGRPMENVMVDLETLGQTPGCVILSIGAVGFDPSGLGKEFYAVVSTADCKKAGLFTDPDTIEWWDKQSPAAQEVRRQADDRKQSMPLKTALDGFNMFLQGFAPNTKIWGNGSDFDNAILASAYRAAGRQLGWKFWNNRCFRTVKNMAPKSIEPAREGTYHHALDDAKHQALHAIAIHDRGIAKIF
jgi:hypothetical protein